MTLVVNVHKADYDVYIGRPSMFGNPFPLKNPRDDAERWQVIEMYKTWFLTRVVTDERFRVGVEKLRDKRLGCHCKPKICHGDIITAYLAGELTDELESARRA